MTRKQIREGLDQVPIEAVLIGVTNPAGVSISPKDREFARQVALGESKASAYRKSRQSKAKPSTASKRGSELMKRGDIQGQVEAFKLAIEAEKSRTPAHLRAFVIHKLTEKALDASVPPAQQIKALELLGKVTEVAAFTERREVVQIKNPDEIRKRLMDSIRAAIKGRAIDAEVKEVDSLLAEIGSGRGPDTIDAPAAADPPGGDPPNLSDAQPQTVHSNPHIQSASETVPAIETNSPTDITTVEVK